MEKITQISINSILFSLENSAYTKLSSYIEEINNAFKNENGGQEIIKDIEARIAEHFKDKNLEIITLIDVEEVINIMGSVDQLTGKEDVVSEKNDSSKIKRRLFRDEENAVIGGVCAGIAAYLDTDVTWIRILFVILGFIGLGMIVIIYLILWLVIPPAETTAEKIEMRGIEPNIHNIVDTVRNRINDLHENKSCCGHSENKNRGCCSKFWTKIKTILDKIFFVLGKIIRFFTGFILSATGLGIIIGSSIGITFALSINRDPGIQQFLIQSGALSIMWLLITIASISIIIPCMVMILGGISIIRKKPITQIRYGLALFAIWMLSVIAGIVMCTHFGIKFNDYIQRQYHGRYSNQNGTVIIQMDNIGPSGMIYDTTIK